MFWNDIKSLNEWATTISSRLTDLQMKIDAILQDQEDRGSLHQMIEDVFNSDDEYSTINRIHDKLNILVKDEERKHSVQIAEKTLDKFDDYMKNIDKLNALANEFKGCVSLARGALEERRELEKQAGETAKLAKISQEIYNSMLSFIKAGENIKHEAHFKIDAIYRVLCESEEKKPPKKRKPVKKKKAVPASLSQ